MARGLHGLFAAEGAPPLSGTRIINFRFPCRSLATALRRWFFVVPQSLALCTESCTQRASVLLFLFFFRLLLRQVCTQIRRQPTNTRSNDKQMQKCIGKKNRLLVVGLVCLFFSPRLVGASAPVWCWFSPRYAMAAATRPLIMVAALGRSQLLSRTGHCQGASHCLTHPPQYHQIIKSNT